MVQSRPSARPRRAALALAAAASAAAALPSPAGAIPSAPGTAPGGVVGQLHQAFGRSLPPVRLTPRPVGTPRRPARISSATRAVRRMEAAGDRIATKPYIYGGGHGSFDAAGYDCSGSVSYVLHAAGLLDAPMASGGFTSYGRPGKGRRVTIYANAGHMFMVIDGRRFDTIAFKQSGSRWSDTAGSTAGYVVRHPAGL